MNLHSPSKSNTHRVTPVEFRGDLWHQKARVPVLSCGNQDQQPSSSLVFRPFFHALHSRYSLLYRPDALPAAQPTASFCVVFMEIQVGADNTHSLFHSRLKTFLCPGLPGWAGTREVKPIRILLKQRRRVAVVSAGMQLCTSLQTDNHASTPPLSFLQAGCPSCRPTNSIFGHTRSSIHIIKFLALFWYVCILRLAISTNFAKNVAYFPFNSWLSFQRLCHLLWGYK